MLLHLRGEPLVVERTLQFKGVAQEWTEHRLADDRHGRSLWFEVQLEPDYVLTVYERLPEREEPTRAPELARDGRVYELTDSGFASYRSVERAGPGKRGRLEYVEYESGPERIAYERFDVGPWEVSVGRVIEPTDVQLD